MLYTTFVALVAVLYTEAAFELWSKPDPNLRHKIRETGFAAAYWGILASKYLEYGSNLAPSAGLA